MMSIVSKVNDEFIRLDNEHCNRCLFELEMDSLEVLQRTEAMRIVYLIHGIIFEDQFVCETFWKRLSYVLVYRFMYRFNRIFLRKME